MRSYRSLAIGLSLLGVLGVSMVLAQNKTEESQRRPLDAEVVAVRLLLGVGDRQEQAWDGRVKIDRGEIVDIEGYRFRKGDQVTGRDGWEARSHIIRKVAAKKAAVLAKTQGKASGPSSFGPAITPNGVIVSLKAPMEATLTVSSPKGEVKIPLADLSEGNVRSYLDGKIEAQRIPTSVPLVESRYQEDFPTAAADLQGGAWIAYVVHKPFGPEVSEAYTKRPQSFDDLAPKGGGDQVRLLRFAGGKAGATLDVHRRGA